MGRSGAPSARSRSTPARASIRPQSSTSSGPPSRTTRCCKSTTSIRISSAYASGIQRFVACLAPGAIPTLVRCCVDCDVPSADQISGPSWSKATPRSLTVCQYRCMTDVMLDGRIFSQTSRSFSSRCLRIRTILQCGEGSIDEINSRDRLLLCRSTITS